MKYVESTDEHLRNIVRIWVCIFPSKFKYILSLVLKPGEIYRTTSITGKHPIRESGIKDFENFSSTPRIWFSLTRINTAEVCLIASNLGNDVGINIDAQIRTKTVKFRFKWPCILPKEQLYIDLPNEISSINNLGMMEYIKIKYKYLDSELSIYEGVQEIDPKLMEEGLKGYLESEVVEEAVEDV